MNKEDEKENEKDCCKDTLSELSMLVKMFLYGVAELEGISDNIGKEVAKVCGKLERAKKLKS